MARKFTVKEIKKLPVMRRYEERSKRFHESVGAGREFIHNKLVHECAVIPNIITPRAAAKETKKNPHNRVLSQMIWYHTLKSPKSLPRDLEHGEYVRQDFQCMCDLKALDVNPDRDMKKYGEILSRRIFGAPPLALLVQLADLMTVHGEILMQERKSKNLFRIYGDWKVAKKAVAEVALKIYGPFADRLGFQPAQRAINELAVAELFPKQLERVRTRKEELSDKIEKTRSRLLENVLSGFMKSLGCNDISRDFPATLSTDSGSWDIVMRDDKSDGSAVLKIERRKKYKDITDFHDLAAALVRAPNEDAIYNALAKLTGPGGIIAKMLKKQGLVLGRDFEIKVADLVANPKSNGYRSLHIDVEIMHPDWVSFEIIIRTHKMHYDAEGGGAAHYLYKGGRQHDGVLSDYEGLTEMLSIGSPDFIDQFAISRAVHAPECKVRVHGIKDGREFGEFVRVPVGSTVIDAIAKLADINVDLNEGFRLRGRSRLSSALHHNQTVELILGSDLPILASNAARTLIASAHTLEAAKMLHKISKEGNGNGKKNGKNKKKKKKR